MKALIFNSGLGSRLGELTAHNPKCMVELSNGETIFGRQIRVLMQCGIRDFVVTTGPFDEQLKATAERFESSGARFSFVSNPVFRETNYIYSMYLAREQLRGEDILLLHGDLVFDAASVQALLDSPVSSLGSVDPSLPLPEKDFKARIVDGEIREVGVGIFGNDCVAFQALYKLSSESLGIWLDAVERFVDDGNTGVYAENAANTVFDQMHVKAFSYECHCCEEIDTPEDLLRVSEQIRLLDFEQQPVFMLDGNAISLAEGRTTDAIRTAGSLGELVDALCMDNPLVIADGFFAGIVDKLFGGALSGCTVFSGYSPNPRYEEVVAGVNAYRAGGCDGLISLGGGSAIDVAKCIKLFAPMDNDGVAVRFTDLPKVFSPIPHVAIPTTAGTGSESTHFAVVYVDGTKSSVTHPCIHPDAVVLVPELLAGLPAYQKKSTMLDALAQAIESYWSRRSSAESRSHSCRSIPTIMGNWKDYLAGDPLAARKIMLAANQAGKAINITTTTAAHAMSYKITSIYGYAHGHAVAMCLPYCWQRLLQSGDEDVQARLAEIDSLMTGDEGCRLGDGLVEFERLYAALELPYGPENPGSHLGELVSSVNLERLSNFPVALSEDDLRAGYMQILDAFNRQYPA